MAVKKSKVKKKVIKRGAVILPRKMSALIKIALRDIRKAEKVPAYVIDMGRWHAPVDITCSLEFKDSHGGVNNRETLTTQKACVVCAAGSVMAFSLKADPTQELEVSDFGKNEQQLSAIDDLRTGDIFAAADTLDIMTPKLEAKLDAIQAFDIPSYERENPEPFHKAMEKMRAVLVKNGL